jgi:hypothetical protein
MEPLNDNELNQLLRKWNAPDAPSTLSGRVLPARISPWRWIFTGTIRVPVPLALAAVVLIALWIHYSRPGASERAPDPASVSLSDFKPVRQLEPVVVSGGRR